MFLEQIEFIELSEDIFGTFVDIFDISEMSTPLWNKLSKCVLSQTKIATIIIVGGYDTYNQLGETPNNICEYDSPTIFPPLNFSLDSYSVYGGQSVVVTRGGSLHMILCIDL